MKFIDLTCVMDKDASMYPDPIYFPPQLTFLYTPKGGDAPADLKLAPAPNITVHSNSKGDGFRYTGYAMFHMHTGTHMDTPKHFSFNENGVETVPLEKICGDCIVVKIPQQLEGPVLLETVKSRMPQGVETKGKKLLIMCGYNNAFWGRDDYFENVCYVSEELAQWIVDSGFTLVGLDMLTDIPGPCPTHRILLGNGVYIAECLTNYDAVPDDLHEAEIYVAPIPFRGMEAAPIRAFLKVND